MTESDLQVLISKGESEHLEFKSAAVPPEVVAKIICGFLNSGGGQLLLGVGDKGEIVGIADAERKLRRLESELPNLISPSALWTVQLVPFAGQDLLLIDVPQGQDKPYVVAGAIYLRRDDRIVPATRNEI